MKALTIYNPWAHLISHGDKLIENRSWEPPWWIMDEDFAIHAGATWNAEGSVIAEVVHGKSIPKKSVTFGSIVAVAKVVGVVTSAHDAEVWAPGHGKWFSGPFGWVLSDIRIVSPGVPARGYQKLWYLSEDQEAMVQHRLKQAQRRIVQAQNRARELS